MSRRRWDGFYHELKTLETFACNPLRLKRYVGTFLPGSALETTKPMFNKPMSALYNKRLLEVSKFCRMLAEPALRGAWDASKFVQIDKAFSFSKQRSQQNNICQTDRRLMGTIMMSTM